MTTNQLPAKIDQLFRPLCRPVKPAAVPTIRQTIDNYRQQIQTRLSHNEFLDLQTAEMISQRLHFLLDRYTTYSAAQQALIIGAARYFIKEDDAEHDTHAFLGLDDDALVVNYVLEVTGHSDQTISL